jgi:hypothetical protein
MAELDLFDPGSSQAVISIVFFLFNANRLNRLVEFKQNNGLGIAMINIAALKHEAHVWDSKLIQQQNGTASTHLFHSPLLLMTPLY